MKSLLINDVVRVYGFKIIIGQVLNIGWLPIKGMSAEIQKSKIPFDPVNPVKIKRPQRNTQGPNRHLSCNPVQDLKI